MWANFWPVWDSSSRCVNCAFLKKTCLPAAEGHISLRAFWKNVILEYMLLLLEFLGYAGTITHYIPSLPAFLLLCISSHSKVFQNPLHQKVKWNSLVELHFYFSQKHFLRWLLEIIMGFRHHVLKRGSMFLNMLKFGLIWHLSPLKRGLNSLSHLKQKLRLESPTFLMSA